MFLSSTTRQTWQEKKGMPWWKESEGKSNCCFFVNAAGFKEHVPVVIGKAAKPRCFKNLKNPNRPAGLAYYSNKKSWMTTNVMNDVLANINRNLRKQKRKEGVAVGRQCFLT